MTSVVKVVSTIPTDLNDKTVVQLLKYFAKKYSKSNTIEEFNEKISNDDNMSKMPYSNAYSYVILYLINGFNNMYVKSLIEPNKNLVKNTPIESTKQPNASIGKGKISNYINNKSNNVCINKINTPQKPQNSVESFSLDSFDQYSQF